MHDPTDPKACHGCKHLRYAPQHGIGNDATAVIPAWASPGQFRCRVFGILCGADTQPRSRTETCKETY